MILIAVVWITSRILNGLSHEVTKYALIGAGLSEFFAILIVCF